MYCVWGEPFCEAYAKLRGCDLCCCFGDCVFRLFFRMLPAQIIEYYSPSGPPPPPPPPVIPSAQTAFVSPLQIPMQPSFPASAGSSYTAPPHPPSSGLLVTAPPPPGPPPPPPGPPGAGSSLSSSPMHGPPVAEAKRQDTAQPPISDARSDLLAAIRMGKWSTHMHTRPQRDSLSPTSYILVFFKYLLSTLSHLLE